MLLVPCLGIASACGQDQKPPVPLTFRLIAHRTEYVNPTPEEKRVDKRPCYVAIEFELKNTGDKKLLLHMPPEPALELTGPRPEAVGKGTTAHFFVPQETQVQLAPGATYSRILRTLTYRQGAVQHRLNWLEAGEYQLKATFALEILPAVGKTVRLQKIDPKSPGYVLLQSTPIQLKIREGSVVDEWTAALADRNHGLRQTALLNLAAIGEPAAPSAKTVTTLLGDTDASMRADAVAALQAFGPKAKDVSLPALLQALKDESKPVRLATIRAIAHVAAGEMAIGPALRLLLRDPDKDIRLEAAQAWYDMPFRNRHIDSADTKALLDALQAETMLDVRHRIITALGHHSQFAVLDALVPYLKSDDKQTKLSVLQTLGRQGAFIDRDPKRATERKRSVQPLVAAIVDSLKETDLVVHAAYALGQIGPDAAPAVPALLDALDDPRNQHKDSIHHPRVLIIHALRDIGPGAKAAQRALATRMLSDPDTLVRQYAAQALAYLEADPNIVGAALNQALRDSAIQVRQEVPRALAKIGAVDALLDGLEDQNPETRTSVIQALAEMKAHAKRIAPPLIKVMQEDKVAGTRGAAASALGLLKFVDAIPPIAKAMKDADANVRSIAIDTLRDFGPDARSAIAALSDAATKDANRQNRAKALWALAFIGVKGHPKLVPMLTAMLSQKDAELVLPAIHLVGQIGVDARDARSHLERISQQKGPEGDAARDALRKIASP